MYEQAIIQDFDYRGGVRVKNGRGNLTRAEREIFFCPPHFRVKNPPPPMGVLNAVNVLNIPPVEVQKIALAFARALKKKNNKTIPEKQLKLLTLLSYLLTYYKKLLSLRLSS